MDPVRIGEMNRRVSIETYTTSRDTDGAEIRTPSTLCTVWAKVEPLSGTERIAGQQITSETTHTFTVRYRPALTARMRVTYAGKQYEILAVLHDEARHITTALECKLINQ